MPSLPLRPCTYSGCPKLVARGRCADHQRAPKPIAPRLYDDRRGSSTARGYDRHWGKLRLTVLNENPFCACGMKAVEVDHKIPKRSGGTDERSNLQSICRSCHARKTKRENRPIGI